MLGAGNNSGNTGRNSNFSMMIRIVGGGYVAYMGWELCKGVINGENPEMIFMAFGILFILIGGFFVVSGIRTYLRDQKLQKEEDERAAALAAEEAEEYEEIEEIEEIEATDENNEDEA